MDRSEYSNEFRRLRLSRSLKNSKLPEEVFEFGWSLAQFKPKEWIVERVSFWLSAYTIEHKWVNRDFIYEINEEAHEKAKAHRKRIKAQEAEIALQKANKPRPMPEPEKTWEECNGPPQALYDLSEKLGSK